MAKASLQIKSLARAHTERAIQVLAGIMDATQAKDSDRIAAAMALLNRGWGQPTQLIGGDEDHPLKIERIERVIVNATDSDSRSLPTAH
jgi:hypothetical protein